MTDLLDDAVYLAYFVSDLALGKEMTEEDLERAVERALRILGEDSR